MRFRVPPPISGGLILSYQCPPRCRQGMYACSPEWEAEWISHRDLEKALSTLAPRIQPSPWGPNGVGVNEGLHLTGGEPFMNLELLVKAVEMADAMGIPSVFAETNAYWCTSEKEASLKLRRLKRAGLKGILVSVNPFYSEWVPFERTRTCIEAARDVFGSKVIVYHLEYYRRLTRLGVRRRMSVDDYLRRSGHELLADSVELFLMARGNTRRRSLYAIYPAELFLDGPCHPPFIRQWHNHFDNYGNYMPGFCAGISLGRWHELDRLIEEGIELEEHPVLKSLVAEDLRGLLGLARDYGYKETDKGYLSRCHLCLDVRKYLADRDDFNELQPKAFYDHLG